MELTSQKSHPKATSGLKCSKSTQSPEPKQTLLDILEFDDGRQSGAETEGAVLPRDEVGEMRVVNCKALVVPIPTERSITQ